MGKRVVDEEMRFSIIINGDPAQKELQQLDSDTRKLTATNKNLRAERDKLRAQGKQNTAEYKKLTAAIKQNNSTLDGNKARMKELQNQIGVTGLTMAQLQRRASQLKLQLRNMIPGSAEYKRLQLDLTATNSRIKQLATQANAAKFSLRGLADGFNRYTALGVSVIAGLTGIVFSIQRVIDFNSELADAQSNVQKTTSLTKDEVEDLTKSFGDFDTRSTRMELLALSEEAGRLGIRGVENIRGFVESANEMKVALGDDLSDEAIREVGKMTNIFQVGEQTGRNFEKSMQSLGSAINEISASGANTADFLVDFMKRTAGVSDLADIQADKIVGLAAAFDELGQSREISATAINKTLLSMGENVSDFASIAGLSIAEFSKLLEEDANEALIVFLEGINKGNPSMETMAKRLEGIELGGTRGMQAIAALASNTELLRKRQEQAGVALRENTSLTNEYNLKNQNFAAVIEKINKSLNGFLAGLKAPLEGFIRGFADLFGIVDDVSEAFEKQNVQTFKAAQNNRSLARESSRLLQEYKELTKDGVEPTIEVKERLETITLLLKDRLGESVLMIDEETGAFKLNTEAVKEQIKLKRLQADEEASTLASRLQGAKDSIESRKEEQKIAQREVELRLKNFRKLNPDGGRGALQSDSNRVNASASAFNSLPGIQELNDARKQLSEINLGLSEQIESRDDLIQKLKDLNFDPEDVEAFFNPSQGSTGPKEGETKKIGDISFVYKNGKWERVRTTQNNQDSLNSEKQFADQLLQLTRDNQDSMLEVMQEGLEKELAIEDLRNKRAIEDLEGQLVSQEQIEDLKNKKKIKQANRLLLQNEQINKNIETQDEIHQQKRSQIFSDGIEDEVRLREDQYLQEQVLIQEARNEKLRAVASSEEDTLKLKDEFRREDLAKEKAHIQELKGYIQNITDTDTFKGFDIELLTEEQKNQIVARLKVLGLEISQINLLLAQMSNGGQGDALGDLGLGGNTDILGFTPEQYDTMFTNFSNLENVLESVVMVAAAANNAFAMFSNMRSKNENARMQQLEQNNNREKQILKDRLDSGYINERQYNDAVANMDLDLEKKKEELAKKQAEREQTMALASIAINTAQAIMSIWAQVPKFDFGISAGILTGFVSALGVAQAAMVLSTPGYEEGFYREKFPVKREQDGKMFNAVNGGMSRSGIVNQPTMFLAGEEGKRAPEMIITGGDYAKLTPDLKETLNRQLSTVRGFQDGFYKEDSSTSKNDELLNALFIMVSKNSKLLDTLIKDGIMAKVIANESNARELQEALDKFKKRKESSKL
jgi:TP901 family phage tail tape measure protein